MSLSTIGTAALLSKKNSPQLVNSLLVVRMLGLKVSDIRVVDGLAQSVRVIGRAARKDKCHCQSFFNE